MRGREDARVSMLVLVAVDNLSRPRGKGTETIKARVDCKCGLDDVWHLLMRRQSIPRERLLKISRASQVRCPVRICGVQGMGEVGCSQSRVSILAGARSRLAVLSSDIT